MKILQAGIIPDKLKTDLPSQKNVNKLTNVLPLEEFCSWPQATYTNTV